MPSLPCPSGQNEELGLPLTELQSWGQEGTLGCTQLQSEEKAFPFSAWNPSHPLHREPLLRAGGGVPHDTILPQRPQLSGL